MRLLPTVEKSSEISFDLNHKYVQHEFIKTIAQHWEDGTKMSTADTELYDSPFQLCILKDFFEKNITKDLVKEMINLDWKKKHMDLYEFHQSKDLSTIKTGQLNLFFKVLENTIKPLIENICKLKIQHVSASCSMYNSGDYLLVHDDLLTDRQIAFVFYICPWKNVQTWSKEMGGCLEMLEVDSNSLPKLPAIQQICPRDNQFVFFKVGKKSFHQVAEVTNFNYPRLTINGWFHGEINKDLEKSTISFKPDNIYRAPILNVNSVLDQWINSDYLKKETMKRIQKHIEHNSEISLENFLQQSVFNELSEQLQSNQNLIWKSRGPANSRNYETLDLNHVDGVLKDFLNLINSSKMYKLLYKLTCLDLSGKNCKNPLNYIEIQKWTAASYTVLGYESSCQDSTLDLILYFNANECVGVTTYLTQEDNPEHETSSETTLLTVHPKNNVLSIVYAASDSIKFTKYVSNNIQMSKGPVYIMYCSFKE